ncbi:protein FAM200B-like [Octopus sinensis]|uniref:Protein FAM200B-like n=1 Tax=Octopus sinensis TaxID=2607531 RepID=A0A6P7S6A4_9MOLL|nr:protein FAM200B-like [Octopus sinensis]
MLGQLYELREEVAILLDLLQKADLHDKFQSEGFHQSLAYLVDIFEALNALDLKLQGENINILTNFDSELKEQIIIHLTDLKKEFIRFFLDIDEKREAWKFIRSSFQCEVTGVLDEVQEEFLELKFNSPAKEDFQELDLETFWIKYLPVYALISHHTFHYSDFRYVWIYVSL